jgi:hypothetical protein
MKHLIAVAAAVVLGACHYDFAAIAPNRLPVEPELTGRWIQAQPPEPGEIRQTLVVTPSRQGGAFVDLKVDKDANWYFRAHALAEDLPGLYQLEFLGASDGQRPGEKWFTIARATIDGGNLSWSLVDPDKVGEVKDGPQLLQRIRDAARKHKQITVFGEPLRFSRAD